MKLNKGKNKGKVHPSPSPSSSSSTPSSNDAVSSLTHLLPTAILTLISILSLQDKEVLAYMITHSLSSSSTNTNTNNNKQGGGAGGKKKGLVVGTQQQHKVPAFDCGCFDCFASYWYKWDSSPHRELIHQAIEAFEEHLSTSDHPKICTPNRSSKKKDRLKKFTPTSTAGVAASAGGVLEEDVVVVVVEKEEEEVEVLAEVVGPVAENNGVCSSDAVAVEDEVSGAQQERQVKQQQQQQQHKGLARKVLPDVIGIFNSRLWNLWGPNV